MKLAQYINILNKRRVVFLIRQLFFSLVMALFIINLFSLSVKANSVEVSNNYYISNNILSISEIIDLNTEDNLSNELKQLKFNKFDHLKYYRNQKQGIKFIFDNFSISYYSNNNHGIRASKQTLKFLNRINNYNDLNKINDIYLREQKIDFNVLKLSYLSEKYELKNIEIDFGFDLNYYQGENFSYDVYSADVNLKNSVNPFYEDPIQVRGNWKEYYNLSQKNNGFGFGFNSEIYWEGILFALDIDNIGASINWNKVKYKNKNIDTENVSFDQDDKIEYNSTITGSWIDFGYKMNLPLTVNFKIDKEFDKWNLGTKLKWKEWRISDLTGTDYLNQILFVTYNNNNHIYKYEYDFKNSLTSFSFASNYFKCELLTNKIDIKNAQTLALKAVFNYNF